jgi:hypothetical protein
MATIILTPARRSKCDYIHAPGSVVETLADLESTRENRQKA